MGSLRYALMTPRAGRELVPGLIAALPGGARDQCRRPANPLLDLYPLRDRLAVDAHRGGVDRFNVDRPIDRKEPGVTRH